MNLYFDDKNICMRIRVSCENQEQMKKYIGTTATPLFELKHDQYFTVKFEYKSFTCSYQGKKQNFSYRDITKAETQTEGILIYLNNGTYLSIATDKSAKHNAELYDISAFLKRHYRRIFNGRTEISYPDDEDGRYKTDKEPVAQISFTLSEGELRRMLWYDYLFDEKMLAFISPSLVFLLLSIALWNVWLLAVSVAIDIFCLILSKYFFDGIDGYLKNHRGQLSLLEYSDLLVVRLRNTDLELEYNTMKRLNPFFGLWRLKSGNFFVLTLPKRIEKENRSFFDELGQKIK